MFEFPSISQIAIRDEVRSVFYHKQIIKKFQIKKG